MKLKKRNPIDDNLDDISAYEPESYTDFLGWFYFPAYVIYPLRYSERKLHQEKIIIELLRLSVKYNNPLACFYLRKYLLKLSEIDELVNEICCKELADLHNRCMQIKDDAYDDYLMHNDIVKILVDYELKDSKFDVNLSLLNGYQIDYFGYFNMHPWLLLIYNDPADQISMKYFYLSVSKDIRIFPYILSDLRKSGEYDITLNECLTWLVSFTSKYPCVDSYYILAKTYLEMGTIDIDIAIACLTNALILSDVFGPIGYEYMIMACELHVSELEKEKNIKKKQVSKYTELINKSTKILKDFYGGYLVGRDGKIEVEKII